MLGQRIGNYRVVRQLGEGGMGVVYEAVRDDIGSRAAIKLLRPEYALNAETASRFFNEARATNLIDHPSIVKIFDYGQLPNGVPYLAMELLAGESLHQRLQREHRLSEPDTVRLGRQVATALAAAHAKEVVHRDLKPENIFIVPDVEASGGERAKILDFGIAKLARGETGSVRTHTNAVMGTPIYMSPEQCKGSKHVGDRADVYALGVMLFEMMAGRPPFIAEEAGEYIGMHLFKEPPSLNSLVPTVSPGLHNIVSLMLLKDPQARPTMVMAASALKMLSNLTSDVVSLRSMSNDALPMATAPSSRSAARARPAAPMALAPAAPVPAPVVFEDSESETLLLKPSNLAGRRPAQGERVAAPGAGLAAGAMAAPAGFAAKASGPKAAVGPQGGRAGMPGLERPGVRSLPSDWQPVEVLAAPTVPLENLDPDISSSKLPKPRSRGLGRQLRRLRFRAKQQFFKWIGMPMTEQNAKPSGTMLLRRRNVVLIIALGVAIAIVLAVLFAGERPS